MTETQERVSCLIQAGKAHEEKNEKKQKYKKKQEKNKKIRASSLHSTTTAATSARWIKALSQPFNMFLFMSCFFVSLSIALTFTEYTGWGTVSYTIENPQDTALDHTTQDLYVVYAQGKKIDLLVGGAMPKATIYTSGSFMMGCLFIKRSCSNMANAVLYGVFFTVRDLGLTNYLPLPLPANPDTSNVPSTVVTVSTGMSKPHWFSQTHLSIELYVGEDTGARVSHWAINCPLPGTNSVSSTLVRNIGNVGNPLGTAITADDNTLFATGYAQDAVYKLTPMLPHGGTPVKSTIIAAGDGLDNPRKVTMHPAHTSAADYVLFVGNNIGGNILQYNSVGATTTVLVTISAATASRPQGVTIKTDGTFIVSAKDGLKVSCCGDTFDAATQLAAYQDAPGMGSAVAPFPGMDPVAAATEGPRQAVIDHVTHDIYIAHYFAQAIDVLIGGAMPKVRLYTHATATERLMGAMIMHRTCTDTNVNIYGLFFTVYTAGKLLFLPLPLPENPTEAAVTPTVVEMLTGLTQTLYTTQTHLTVELYLGLSTGNVVGHYAVGSPSPGSAVPSLTKIRDVASVTNSFGVAVTSDDNVLFATRNGAAVFKATPLLPHSATPTVTTLFSSATGARIIILHPLHNGPTDYILYIGNWGAKNILQYSDATSTASEFIVVSATETPSGPDLYSDGTMLIASTERLYTTCCTDAFDPFTTLANYKNTTCLPTAPVEYPDYGVEALGSHNAMDVAIDHTTHDIFVPYNNGKYIAVLLGGAMPKTTIYTLGSSGMVGTSFVHRTCTSTGVTLYGLFFSLTAANQVRYLPLPLPASPSTSNVPTTVQTLATGTQFACWLAQTHLSIGLYVGEYSGGRVSHWAVNSPPIGAAIPTLTKIRDITSVGTPYGASVTSDDNILFVATGSQHKIYKATPMLPHSATRTVTLLLAGADGINFPQKLALHPLHNSATDFVLYVGNAKDGNIFKYDASTSTGNQLIFFSTTTGYQPHGVTFHPNGNLIIAAQDGLKVSCCVDAFDPFTHLADYKNTTCLMNSCTGGGECASTICNTYCCTNNDPNCNACDSMGTCTGCTTGTLTNGWCALGVGSTCVANGQCTSGTCANSFCCTNNDAQCTACDAGTGTCTSCAATHYLDGSNACQPKITDGAVCTGTPTDECSSGTSNCKNSVCCTNTNGQDANCDTCGASGACTACLGNFYVVSATGNCATKLSPGGDCTADQNAACDSGSCKNSICCTANNAANGDCTACGASGDCTACTTGYIFAATNECATKLTDATACTGTPADECASGTCHTNCCDTAGVDANCNSCDGTTGACNGCAATFYLDNAGACQTIILDGGDCSAANAAGTDECSSGSGHCKTGVCCDATNGADANCQACDGTNSGVCLTCVATHYVVSASGTCATLLTPGDDCTADQSPSCDSGSCKNNFCCTANNGANGDCTACGAAGACTACTTGYIVTATNECATKIGDGAACTGAPADECASGSDHCKNGVCCAATNGGDANCQACDGTNNGVCLTCAATHYVDASGNCQLTTPAPTPLPPGQTLEATPQPATPNPPGATPAPTPEPTTPEPTTPSPTTSAGTTPQPAGTTTEPATTTPNPPGTTPQPAGTGTAATSTPAPSSTSQKQVISMVLGKGVTLNAAVTQLATLLGVSTSGFSHLSTVNLIWPADQQLGQASVSASLITQLNALTDAQLQSVGIQFVIAPSQPQTATFPVGTSTTTATSIAAELAAATGVAESQLAITDIITQSDGTVKVLFQAGTTGGVAAPTASPTATSSGITITAPQTALPKSETFAAVFPSSAVPSTATTDAEKAAALASALADATGLPLSSFADVKAVTSAEPAGKVVLTFDVNSNDAATLQTPATKWSAMTNAGATSLGPALPFTAVVTSTTTVADALAAISAETGVSSSSLIATSAVPSPNGGSHTIVSGFLTDAAKVSALSATAADSTSATAPMLSSGVEALIFSDPATATTTTTSAAATSDGWTQYQLIAPAGTSVDASIASETGSASDVTVTQTTTLADGNTWVQFEVRNKTSSTALDATIASTNADGSGSLTNFSPPTTTTTPTPSDTSASGTTTPTPGETTATTGTSTPTPAITPIDPPASPNAPISGFHATVLCNMTRAEFLNWLVINTKAKKNTFTVTKEGKCDTTTGTKTMEFTVKNDTVAATITKQIEDGEGVGGSSGGVFAMKKSEGGTAGDDGFDWLWIAVAAGVLVSAICIGVGVFVHKKNKAEKERLAKELEIQRAIEVTSPKTNNNKADDEEAKEWPQSPTQYAESPKQLTRQGSGVSVTEVEIDDL